MRREPRVHIGTSGWHYAHWRGPFYPNDTPSSRWLSFYAEHFDTAEINNSFYRLPLQTTFAAWREAVPAGFIFAVKASRFITHMKKLGDPEQSTARFFERVAPLKNRLGPILFQLPPRWRANRARLEAFLASVPRGYRYAFELRDVSWFDAGVYDLLSAYGAAFCIYQLGEVLSPSIVTADFVYVRLHGPAGKYAGRYGASGLKPWAEHVREWSGAGRDVFFYFDNDQAAYAVMDALDLRRLTGMSTRRAKPRVQARHKRRARTQRAVPADDTRRSGWPAETRPAARRPTRINS